MLRASARQSIAARCDLHTLHPRGPECSIQRLHLSPSSSLHLAELGHFAGSLWLALLVVRSSIPTLRWAPLILALGASVPHVDPRLFFVSSSVASDLVSLAFNDGCLQWWVHGNCTGRFVGTCILVRQFARAEWFASCVGLPAWLRQRCCLPLRAGSFDGSQRV